MKIENIDGGLKRRVIPNYKRLVADNLEAFKDRLEVLSRKF